MVRVIYRDDLAAITGLDGADSAAPTVRAVLGEIKKKHGKAAHKAAKKMLITVNDVSILLLKGFSTKLKEGDTIAFLPICGGG